MATSNRGTVDVAPTMRALCLRARGGAAELTQARLAVPVPGTGDALVRVHGASYTPGELDWPSTWIDRSGHDRNRGDPAHQHPG